MQQYFCLDGLYMDCLFVTTLTMVVIGMQF